MNVTVKTTISKPSNTVWPVITDITNAQTVISGIKSIRILDQPENTLIGLRWKETRELFGKEASEIMWITAAEENSYYCTRAESHGSIYETRLSLSQQGSETELCMSFESTAVSWPARILSTLMKPMIKNSLRKTMARDLEDIKHHVESL